MLSKNIFNFASLTRGKRFFSTDNLKNQISKNISKRKKIIFDLKKSNSEFVVHKVTVNQLLGGMRSIKSMLWDTSLLDPQKGITFHGYNIPDLQKNLVSYKNGQEPMPEAMLHLLLTGEIPNHDQVDHITKELHNRSELPKYVIDTIKNFPKEMHPMTQLSSAILSLQTNSVFAKEYQKGMSKDEYWEHTFEDILNLIAKLPSICALIYRNKYHDGIISEYDNTLDYTGNFCKMLGFDNPKFHDLMRLYLVIHSDHEGGNASAHTCRLVGSTLSDPYLSLSSSMNALAGPLHGLANQEVLKWLLELQNNLKLNNKEPTKENIEEYAWNTLNDGKVIPGYGHAVLRVTDPRYTCQREFALKNLKDDELFKLVDNCYQVIPDVLSKQGKVKNPYPNVDAHSGVLLKYYGLDQYEYYTVLFGLGRSFGVLSQLVWDRILNLPLERPKSVTSKWLQKTSNNL